MILYVLIVSIEMKIYRGVAYQIMFTASKALQMAIAIPIALVLYLPLKKALPTLTENTWEEEIIFINLNYSYIISIIS